MIYATFKKKKVGNGEKMRPDLDFFFFFFFFWGSFKFEQTVEGETRRWLTYFTETGVLTSLFCYCIDLFSYCTSHMIVLYNCGTKKEERMKEITCSKPGYSHWLCNCSLYIEEAVFFGFVFFVVVCVATWISYIVYMSL